VTVEQQKRTHNFVLRLARADGRMIEFHGPADITRETTDAIVNAANSHLAGGGGVDGAIHRAGGPEIMQECRKIIAGRGRLSAGEAEMTGGGRLPAKHVIHAVGPIFRDGSSGEPESLASCYRRAISLADGHKLHSIAFPSISTGAYGYPIAEAAEIAVDAAAGALEQASSVRRVRFVLFDGATLGAYVRAAERFVKRSANYKQEMAPS
jgi:O-acetyl-ADP-ribose deacetylase (regulator of RNase III)